VDPRRAVRVSVIEHYRQNEFHRGCPFLRTQHASRPNLPKCSLRWIKVRIFSRCCHQGAVMEGGNATVQGDRARVLRRRAPLRSLVLMTSEFWLVEGEAKRIFSANPTRLSCLQYRFRLTKRPLSALWRLERQQSSKSERHRSGAARVLQLRKTVSCRAKYSGGLDQMLSATSITIPIPTANTASTMAS
jgi:hypothetical protein